VLENPWLRFLLAVLAVWRITHLLAREDGPWDLIVRLRGRVGDGFWGGLLDCFYCLSVWSALPFALWLGDGWAERGILWPALSGAAILLDRRAPGAAEPLIIETRSDDELLWSEENRAEGLSHSPPDGPAEAPGRDPARAGGASIGTDIGTDRDEGRRREDPRAVPGRQQHPGAGDG
jgi:hypothetical protein